MSSIWLSADDLPPPPPEPDLRNSIPLTEATDEQFSNVQPAELPQEVVSTIDAFGETLPDDVDTKQID